jgi:universal stress protein A
MATKTLLVPVDFSSTSNRALLVAKELASSIDGELVLIHTFEQPFTLGELSPLLMQQFYEEAVPSATRSLESLAKAHGITRTLFREGAPGPEICRAAEELKANFIVMGTHGRTRLRHLVTGSVAAYVIRHASSPVITVRDPST